MYAITSTRAKKYVFGPFYLCPYSVKIYLDLFQLFEDDLT